MQIFPQTRYQLILQWVNTISEDRFGNIWAADQFGNVSNYKRLEDKRYNYYH